MSSPAEDSARFRPDDPAALVAATFACPWCLRPPGRATMTVDPYTPHVVCGCEGCDTSWAIHLDGMQYIRLRIAPPPALAGMTLSGTAADGPRYWTC
ncbi:MAG TPA: hypothetical protein VNT55_06140 [Baekduia sp.]|nr:hypothetical protein [Baekduia sp.]